MRTRLFLALCALAMAGCVDAPAAEVAPDAAADAVEPFAEEGTVWLEPSTGNDRVEWALELPVARVGSRLVAHTSLASMYGPAELPATLANVAVELRAPDGTVLAEAMLATDSPEAELQAEAEEAAAHALVLLSYGGSDGSANGDHVHYRAEVQPPVVS